MESNEVFKVVAQTNEAIFYIGWWLKCFEEELLVTKCSEVLEIMTGLKRIRTHQASFDILAVCER